MTELVAVAVSRRTAPTELLERLAIASDEVSRLRPEQLGASELVVLTTCNRFEFYAAVANAGECSRLLSVLAACAGVSVGALAEAATTRTGYDAVLHLCRVAAGLDSPIPGEPEILGQVRGAASAAASRASSGPLLGRLFACAVRAGRRVRTETALGDGARSLAAVSVDLAAAELGDLSGRRVVVVGAGAMARLAADRFRDCGCELVIVGRNCERVSALAMRVGGRAAELDALDAELHGAAALVSCTRSPGVVVTAARVAAARAGIAAPLLLLDLAVPRDVDPAAATLAACRLYDLDDVQRRAVAACVSAPADEVAAEAIARDDAVRFCDWRRSRAAVTAIASLRGHAEEIRMTELTRVGAKLATLTPEQRRAVEAVTAQIVNKLLHHPTVRVKQAADGALVPALRELFALDEAA